MEQVTFLGMHFACRMGTGRFIAGLDRLFRAVEDLKETMRESEKDAGRFGPFLVQ